MPGTRRTPVTRSPLPVISPAAVKIFEAMRRCRCTCPPIDWEGKYWERQECLGCKRRSKLHNNLCDELGTKLWEWPCVEDPGATCPYPVWHCAYATWRPNLEAQARWRALATASREAKREARRAKAAARKAAAAPAAPPEQPSSP